MPEVQEKTKKYFSLPIQLCFAVAVLLCSVLSLLMREFWLGALFLIVAASGYACMIKATYPVLFSLVPLASVAVGFLIPGVSLYGCFPVAVWVLCGCLIAVFPQRKYPKTYLTASLCTAMLVLLFVWIVLVMELQTGSFSFSALKNAVNEGFNQAQQAVINAFQDYEYVDAEQISNLFAWLPAFLPGILITVVEITALCMIAVYMFLVKIFSCREKFEVSDRPLEASRISAGVFTVAYLSYVITSGTNSVLTALSCNLWLILLPLFVLIGFQGIKQRFKMRALIFNRYIFYIGFVLVLLMYPFFALTFMALIGVFETFARKR